MRILLIEDDMLIGDGIKTGLSKMGFSVDWFTQGRQGKEALYSAPYDAVILDLSDKRRLYTVRPLSQCQPAQGTAVYGACTRIEQYSKNKDYFTCGCIGN